MESNDPKNETVLVKRCGWKMIWDIIHGWLYPKPRSSYRGVEYFRCRSDGQLVSVKSKNLQYHGGHYFVSPVTLTMREKVLIWLKIID